MGKIVTDWTDNISQAHLILKVVCVSYLIMANRNERLCSKLTLFVGEGQRLNLP